MTIVSSWTGADVKALQAAVRMKQAAFAEWVGVDERTVRRWTNGGPIGPFNVSVLDGLLARLSNDQIDAFRRIRSQGTGEEDEVDRRQAIKTGALGIAGLASIGLAGDVADRVQWLLTKVGRADAVSIKVIRNMLHSSMLLDDSLGSPAAQGVTTEQRALTEALLATCPDALRSQMLALHAEWVGLAGCLAWDAGDHDAAARLYTRGRDLAHDAADSDVAAYMLCHLSQLEVWRKRPRPAVDHAVAAKSWVAQSGDRRLRAYVEMRYAEALATADQGLSCRRALDAAEGEMDGIDREVAPEMSRAYFVSPALLKSFRGWCMCLLGHPEQAVEATREAVALIDPARTRDRALMLLELERALLALGDHASAAEAVGDALEASDSNRSPRLVDAITSGRQMLTPWRSSPEVRRLDEQLAVRDMVLM